MKYKNLKDKQVVRDDSIVTVKEMGNIIEINYSSNLNTRPHTIRINKDEYINLKTAEVKKYKLPNENSTRADNINSARKTMKKVKEIIHTNVTDNSKCLWITLTYKENMRSSKKLYDDFVKFHRKFCVYCKKKGINKPEYISVVEPQARGSYHVHLIYIFSKSNVYIPNDIIAKMWGMGFTKTKKIDNDSNLASYLVAYLSDLSIDEEVEKYFDEKEIKKVEVDSIKKSILKGGRLHLYSRYVNIIRHSRGINYPKKRRMTQNQAQELVMDKDLIYHSSFELSDEERDFKTIIDKKVYK